MTTQFKSALITGGAGFIGSNIADALLAEGCTVSVLDNLSTGRLSNLEHIKDRIAFYKGDIQDQEMLAYAAKDCEVIFHLAAVVSVPQTVEHPVDSALVNDIGTLRVFETARRNRVKRVVFSSSCAVYGDDPELPKREVMIPKPLSPYAVQKLTGEFHARLYHDLYGVETVCLRYFNVYGPRQDPSSPYSGVISIFMKKAASKETPFIYGDGTQSRDFVFVKDVVKANLLAASMSKAEGKIFNIGTGRAVTIGHLWEIICTMSRLHIEPAYQPPRPGDIRESLADIDRAKALLGFHPDYLFEKGLEITFEWYRKEA